MSEIDKTGSVRIIREEDGPYVLEWFNSKAWVPIISSDEINVEDIMAVDMPKRAAFIDRLGVAVRACRDAAIMNFGITHGAIDPVSFSPKKCVKPLEPPGPGKPLT